VHCWANLLVGANGHPDRRQFFSASGFGGGSHVCTASPCSLLFSSTAVEVAVAAAAAAAFKVQLHEVAGVIVVAALFFSACAESNFQFYFFNCGPFGGL